MEEPFNKSGHFIRVNRRRMVWPAGDTILEPPTKYILKLKLKKKKKTRENILGAFLFNMIFYQSERNTAIKAPSFIHTIKVFNFPK